MSETQPLRTAWETHAADWIAWARAPGHDSYWRFHRDTFLDLLPAPGRRTLDVGCGEGRLCRDLTARGHQVVGLDGSPTLTAAAAAADEGRRPYLLGDAAHLPLASGSVDLVVAFMSLQDVDDLDRAVAETARVLEPGGRLCMAIVHPLNSAGSFESSYADSQFTIPQGGSYLAERRYADLMERGTLTMTFHSVHRPLETYSRALERAGLAIEALREPPAPAGPDASPRTVRWTRVPLFLHLRARR
jgi:ubiquinone/menaquinone biosynthesis C-methylase UbiE